MTNEQIKKLESRLNEIVKTINERIERMADDELVEEIAKDLVTELEEIREDLLKLLSKPSKICEYFDFPEDNKRILNHIFEIERLCGALGLDSVTHLSKIKNSIFPSIILDWETRWKFMAEIMSCHFHVVAKDVPLELHEFPPRHNTFMLRSKKTIEFEFINAEFKIDTSNDPGIGEAIYLNPEKALPQFEVELHIECVPGTPQTIKDISLKLIYTNPHSVKDRFFVPQNYYWMGFFFNKEELLREDNTYFLFNGWEIQQNNTFAIKHIESNGFSTEFEGMSSFDEKITLSYK